MAAPLPAGDWAATIARATPAIVSMRVAQTRSFEGAAASYSYATGFVVDAALGLILSNRHVVTTAPVRAEAVFANNEEVPVTALYRDPVHDFGLFRYDPSAVRFLSVPSIPLAPHAARVGMDVRVVGNDSGEKLSVLAGTLARLDRPAPVYGTTLSEYNDNATFYIAAASSTSGGSSGSPVLAVTGCALAINAGGKRQAASSFYLPLDRVVRALALVQRGLLPPPRGDIQAVLSHEAFDEARRLGLSGGGEAALRGAFPQETGPLVVEQVLRGGPADGGRGRVWAATAAKLAEAAGAAEVAGKAAGTREGGGGGVTGATPAAPPTRTPTTTTTAAAASTGTAGGSAAPPPAPGAGDDGNDAGGGLEPGDVLLAVNGVAVTHFVPLEEALDNTAAVAAAHANAAVALGLGDDVAAALLAGAAASAEGRGEDAANRAAADCERTLVWLRRATAPAGGGGGGGGAVHAPPTAAAPSRLWRSRAAAGGSAAPPPPLIDANPLPSGGLEDIVTALPSAGTAPLPLAAVLPGPASTTETPVAAGAAPSPVAGSGASSIHGAPVPLHPLQASPAAAAAAGAQPATSSASGAPGGAPLLFSPSAGGMPHAGPHAGMNAQQLATGVGLPSTPLAVAASAGPVAPGALLQLQQRRLLPPQRGVAGTPTAGDATAAAGSSGGVWDTAASVLAEGSAPAAPIVNGAIDVSAGELAGTLPPPPGEVSMPLVVPPRAEEPPPLPLPGPAVGSGASAPPAAQPPPPLGAAGLALAAGGGTRRHVIGGSPAAAGGPHEPAGSPPSTAPTPPSRDQTAREARLFAADTAVGVGWHPEPFLPPHAQWHAPARLPPPGAATAPAIGGEPDPILAGLHECFGDGGGGGDDCAAARWGTLRLQHGGPPGEGGEGPPPHHHPHFHGVALLPRHLPAVAVCEHAAMHAAAVAAARAAHGESSAAVHSHTHTLPVPAAPELVGAVAALHRALDAYVDAAAGGGAALPTTTTTTTSSSSSVAAPPPAGAPPSAPTASAPIPAARAALAGAFAGVLRAAGVSLRLERGGAPLTRWVGVGDFHAALPSAFLEVSGAVIHGASWMAARNNAVPVGGAYVSQTGYALSRADVPQHALIVAVGRVPTPDLPSLEAALAALPDGAKVPLRYTLVSDSHRERVAVLTFDRRWHEMAVWSRADGAGVWHRRPCLPPPPPAPLAPATASFPRLPGASPAADSAWRALALCEVQIPVLADGVHSASFIGVAVVVDAARGLAVADRNTVPVACCDVQLTFAGSVEVPGEVLFLHPTANFAVVGFDPALLGGTPVAALELAPPGAPHLAPGAPTEFVGMTSTGTPIAQACVVTKLERVSVGDASPPRYRAANLAALHFDRVAPCLGGVFLDAQGRCAALWASFSYTAANGDAREMSLGLPAGVVAGVVARLAGGAPPAVPCLDAELREVPLSTARTGFGLPPAWVAALEAAGRDRRAVLCVRRTSPDTPAAAALRAGDLLLAVGGAPVVSFADVDAALAAAYAAQADGGGDGGGAPPAPPAPVPLTLLRDGCELVVPVRPSLVCGRGTERIVSWCGLMVQAPHRAVTDRGFVPEVPPGPDGRRAPPYVSRWSFGSPAHKAGVRATNFVLEVNGARVPTLDAFLCAVTAIGDGRDVRLKCVDLGGRERVYTLRTDLTYWPTSELRLVPPPGAGGQAGADVPAGALAPPRGSTWTLVRHVPTPVAAPAAEAHRG